MSPLTNFVERIVANVERVIVGKHEQVEWLIVAMLCQSNVLIEDVPGTGKTMLARAVAISMGINFNRIQCTPDLLPKIPSPAPRLDAVLVSPPPEPEPATVSVLLK